MAIFSDSLRLSNLNLTGISNSLSSSQKTISTANSTVERLTRTVQSNTKIKRELIDRSSIIRSRRDEASRRRELEDQLESSKVSQDTRSGLSFASKSELNPFGRLLGFLGFITAGWIMDNLPTWIFMGNEFIDRARRLGSYLPNMLSNLMNISQTFTSVIGNSLTSILRLDFDEFSEGSVAKSFEGLQIAIQDLGTNITDTFKLFTTPLTESLETGQQAPDLGEVREDTTQPQYPQTQQEETTGGGKILNPQAAYSYLRQLNVPHIHALGILANIQGESGFRIDSKQPDGPGVGLFQYSSYDRKQAFLQNVPDWKTNWKGQIKYAIGEGVSPAYFKTQFSSPEEAAYWWMNKWERPDPSVYRERNEKHNIFIRNFKPSSGQQQKPPVTPQTQTPQISPPPSTPINPMIGHRLGAGRGHGGVDLQVEEGTPLKAISDGVIVDSDFEKGWGNFLVMKDNMGIYHLYGHMQSGYKSSGSVKKGEVIGKVGKTGRTTGPHLHWETGTGWNGGVITGRFDALNKYSRFAPFNTQLSRETPAQISAPPKPSQPAQITPERRGPQNVIIDDSQPVQQPQVSYIQQQPSVTPTIHESKLLNNFIKNKLLLDLAYL
jgi:murein DD-endopeptidase MepM/ murein hydrolase activator NlpD